MRLTGASGFDRAARLEAAQGAAVALAVMLILGPAAPATALIPELSATDVGVALELGGRSIVESDFGEEWRVVLPGGEEIVVTTPFSRLAHAARHAGFRGEPLTAQQRQEQIDRGRGKLQLLVTMHGRTADFARWFRPALTVDGREVKPTFTQNERTALRLEDGRFAARNVWVFPLEGLPARGVVALVVQSAVDGTQILRAPLDLSKMR